MDDVAETECEEPKPVGGGGGAAADIVVVDVADEAAEGLEVRVEIESMSDLVENRVEKETEGRKARIESEQQSFELRL
jgi:hypothetical protein